jgi:hypothetical protein
VALGPWGADRQDVHGLPAQGRSGQLGLPGIAGWQSCATKSARRGQCGGASPPPARSSKHPAVPHPTPHPLALPNSAQILCVPPPSFRRIDATRIARPVPQSEQPLQHPTNRDHANSTLPDIRQAPVLALAGCGAWANEDCQSSQDRGATLLELDWLLHRLYPGCSSSITSLLRQARWLHSAGTATTRTRACPRCLQALTALVCSAPSPRLRLSAPVELNVRWRDLPETAPSRCDSEPRCGAVGGVYGGRIRVGSHFYTPWHCSDTRRACAVVLS